MLQLPTGGGKTEIAAAVLRDRFDMGRQTQAVWLTHRAELCAQTETRLGDSGIPVRSATRHWQVSTPAPAIRGGVAILQAQTVERRNLSHRGIWSRYGSDDLLVIDEAHHAVAPGWEKAIRQWPGRVLGMTATPWRLSVREGFDHIFDTLIVGPQVHQLQTSGFLAPSRLFTPPDEERIVGGKTRRNSDFTEMGIEAANHPEVMTTKAVLYWMEMAGNRQTIAYAVSKGHARNLAKEFANRAITTAVILSDTPAEERTRAIVAFKRRQVQVLINVAIATEGFDLPDAGCVLITRPTDSLTLYLQMVGRGLRPKPNSADCLILDLPGNSMVHGLPETPRQWSLSPRGDPPLGEAPVLRCRECGFMAHPSQPHCPECGADMGKMCGRCVKFRSWSRWTGEPVCDYCSEDRLVAIGLDADIDSHIPLPVEEQTPYDHANENESDLMALRVFFQSTGGTGWSNNNGWMTEAPLSDWHGVTVNEHGRVTRLDLGSNYLDGEIPASLGQLSHLTALDLGGNNLTGNLPDELSNLTRLIWLNLGNNRLSGRIPASLERLRQLEWLRLNDNALEGSIPPNMGHLSALRVLRLSNNRLFGEIPWELARINNLVVLDLADNCFSGEIPYEFGRLSQLTELDLSNNVMSGEIPVELTRLDQIADVRLSGNKFIGGIPNRLRYADRHDLNTLSLPFVN